MRMIFSRLAMLLIGSSVCAIAQQQIADVATPIMVLPCGAACSDRVLSGKTKQRAGAPRGPPEGAGDVVGCQASPRGPGGIGPAPSIAVRKTAVPPEAGIRIA